MFSIDSLNDKVKYEVKAYGIENSVASVIIVTSVLDPTMDRSIAVVDTITQSLNSMGDVICNLYAYTDGNSVKVPTIADFGSKRAMNADLLFKDLRKGQIITYKRIKILLNLMENIMIFRKL